MDTDAYSVNIDTDEFLSAIAAGGRVATSANFSGKTTTLGVLDADDVVLSTVSVDESEAVVIYKDTGDPATSPLLIYIDSYTGLLGGVTPNGGNITIQRLSGANKIGKL